MLLFREREREERLIKDCSLSPFSQEHRHALSEPVVHFSASAFACSLLPEAPVCMWGRVLMLAGISSQIGDLEGVIVKPLN